MSSVLANHNCVKLVGFIVAPFEDWIHILCSSQLTGTQFSHVSHLTFAKSTNFLLCFLLLPSNWQVSLLQWSCSISTCSAHVQCVLGRSEFHFVCWIHSMPTSRWCDCHFPSRLLIWLPIPVYSSTLMCAWQLFAPCLSTICCSSSFWVW